MINEVYQNLVIKGITRQMLEHTGPITATRLDYMKEFPFKVKCLLECNKVSRDDGRLSRFVRGVTPVVVA